MRVLLINPPFVLEKYEPQVYIPVGLGYLASSLEKRGHKVSILDSQALGWRNLKKIEKNLFYRGLEFDQILDKIKEYKPDLIGIGISFSVLAYSTYKLADRIKNDFRDIPLVLGGPHPTVRPEEALEHCDFVIMGEGERALEGLASQLEKGATPPRKIQGTFIDNLDLLPYPARELLPMEEYAKSAAKLTIHGIRNVGRWATLITSRGCPYDCNFCSIHASGGRKWRPRGSADVLGEIDTLVKAHKIETFLIEDDNMTLDAGRMEEICDGLIMRNYNLSWWMPNGVRADQLSGKLLLKMKQSGLKELVIAPESGSQRVVDKIIGKRLNLKNVEEVVREAHRLSLKVRCFFVIGLPGETKEDMKQTLRFARRLRRLGMYRLCVGFATPFWGTRLLEVAQEKSYLIRGFDPNRATPFKPSLQTEDFSLEWVTQMKLRIENITWFSYMMRTSPLYKFLKALIPQRAIDFAKGRL